LTLKSQNLTRMKSNSIRKKFFATDAEDAEDARIFAINTR